MRHEIAHFWWNAAATGTADDWINEGFAEFAAYRQTRAIEGPEVAQALLARYRAAARAAGAGEPIAATGPDSERGYLNRYVRATLMLPRSKPRSARRG